MDPIYPVETTMTPEDENKQLHALSDVFALSVAQLEKTYRDLGLKFFLFPIEQRSRIFHATDLPVIEATFLTSSNGGETPRAAQLMLALRPALKKVKKHVRRLCFEDPVREFEAAAVRKHLKAAHVVYADARSLIYPLVDKMQGYYPYRPNGGARIPMPIFLSLPGQEGDEDDGRYADFCAWALTVREVRNSIKLGESEDEAVASLDHGKALMEERIIPMPTPVETFNDENEDDQERIQRFWALVTRREDDGGDDADDEGSITTNPWEEADEFIPVSVWQAAGVRRRPSTPQGAARFR